MAEKFLINKAVDFSPNAIGKSTSVWVKGFLPILFLGLLGFTIWKAFFVKEQSQKIIVQKGATALIQQKQEAPKRFFIPFIEAGVEQRSDSNMGTYIRAGMRIEL